MAVDLRRRGFADCVVGVDNDPLHAEVARNIGLVDEILSLEECCKSCDLIIVAVPADAACKVLSSVLDRIGEGQIVIDVCSTKEAICRVADAHARRCRYVATHPMAGTEYSGPWAAKENMFDGNAVILCDTPDDKDAEFIKYLDTLSGVKVAIINKSDLGAMPEVTDLLGNFEYLCPLSASSGEGFDTLEALIEKIYIDDKLDTGNDAIISNARQAAAVNSAIEALEIAIDAIEGELPLEICCAEVENTLSALGELDGRTVSEDIVSRIFANFCVGK